MVGTLATRASFMIAVSCENAAPDVDAIIESVQRLLFDRGVSIARGITRFKQLQSHVLVTKFTDEHQHLNKGTAIAFLKKAQKASHVIAVADFNAHTKTP